MRAPFIAIAVVFSAVAVEIAPAEARPGVARSCLPGSLKTTLSQIESRFGPVQVISTHRPGAIVAGSGRPSRHANCQAVDFRPPQGQFQAVAAWLKRNHNGGLGTYSCGMNHIHIDNGPNYRWNHCVSRTGQRR